MTHAADFRALSELLTGEATLDAGIADAYRQRLSSAFPADLGRLIDASLGAEKLPRLPGLLRP